VTTIETCRAAYKTSNKINKSHLVGQLLNSIHDARIHVYKILLVFIYLKFIFFLKQELLLTAAKDGKSVL